MSVKQLKRYVFPYLPYLFLFWMSGKFGEAYRVSPGADFPRKFMGMFLNVSDTMSRPLLSPDPFDLCAGLIGAAAVFAYVRYKRTHRKKWRKEDVCCKGWQWSTPENTGGTSVCGTDAHRKPKGASL